VQNPNPEPLPLNFTICSGWCPPKVSSLDRIVKNIDCSETSIEDRLRAALQLENCPAAVISAENAWMVNDKLLKLSEFDAFVFFRGAAGFFDLDLM
jgi:hypothetical protein